MACVVNLIRVPRYEGISVNQMKLIQQFLIWQRMTGEEHVNVSFSKWSGTSYKELPPVEVIEVFEQYFSRKQLDNYSEIDGYKNYGIFEKVARFHKASQFLGWIMRNVLRTKEIPWQGLYEISKEQLEQLLEACNAARRYGITRIHSEKESEWEERDYRVNKTIAEAILPILELEKDGGLFFPYKYGAIYGEQVIDAIKVINKILETTDFEKQAIYFYYD